MTTSAIPERVFALCKIVEKGVIQRDQLKEKMEPEYLGNNSSYFNEYYSAAKELGLIKEADGRVTLGVEKSIITTSETMRKYINAKLREFKGEPFFKMTRAFFDEGDGVLRSGNNIINQSDYYREKTGAEINAVALRGWRFWASFLGFAYLQEWGSGNTVLIPNADVFLLDAIEAANIKSGERMSFGEFIGAISPFCEIVMDPTDRSINYGVSNGLRTLHDREIIKLEHELDQEDIWSLYPLRHHEFDRVVTNITIC